MTDKLTKAKQYLTPGAPVPVDIETTTLLLEALRQALAEPPNTDVVEPIGEIQTEQMERPFNAGKAIVHFYDEPPPVGTKLYAAPPKREWVSLTEEEIQELRQQNWQEMWVYTAFARAVEAKLKEKNT